MAMPTYDEFFLPFLRMLQARDQVTLSEAKTMLADSMGVSEEVQHELLPSGRQRRYDNRLGWARTYLSKAGLIRTVKRGVYELTDAGRNLLASNPSEITVDTLLSISDDFRLWQQGATVESPEPADRVQVPASTEVNATPEELMDSAETKLRRALALEVGEALQEVTWGRFEEIVIDVLLALGYGGSRAGAGHAFRKGSDGGVDGVINEDPLGLSKIYVQAKRYAPENRVSRPDVQAFVGSLLGNKARQGVFITTSFFTREAVAYAESIGDLRVILINGEALADFMIEHDVGVSEHTRFVVKRLDRDYFEEA